MEPIGSTIEIDRYFFRSRSFGSNSDGRSAFGAKESSKARWRIVRLWPPRSDREGKAREERKEKGESNKGHERRGKGDREKTCKFNTVDTCVCLCVRVCSSSARATLNGERKGRAEEEERRRRVDKRKKEIGQRQAGSSHFVRTT